MSEFVALLPEWVESVTLTHVLLFTAAALAFLAWRRSGMFFSRLELENRRLRRGISGYAVMEQEHRELSREARVQNLFQDELPLLVAQLAEERSVPGLIRQITHFTARILEAQDVQLFLVDGGRLRLEYSTKGGAAPISVRIGEGPIGLAAELRRPLTREDLRALDRGTRERALSSGSGKHVTAVAAPLLAHGQLLAVLNVGGTVGAPESVHREIVSVVSQLAATAIENQINFERLEREATTDGLTRLSNVRNFRDKLAVEIARASRFGRPLSVFLFDIDHFKNYNDRNGHAAGDECLRMTADILRSGVRRMDLPARYGGEEFVVLLPETGVEGGLAAAEKIRAAIAAADYPHREGQPLGCVSISGGVATYPRHGMDSASLLAAADAALYRCKEAGRNRVAIAADASAPHNPPEVRH